MAIKELRLLSEFIRVRGKSYLVNMLFLFFSSLTGLFVPWYMKLAIDSLGDNPGKNRFLSYISIMVAFAFFHMVFRFAGRRGFLVSAREIEGDIRERLFERVIDAPYQAFGRRTTGDLMSRSVNDLSSLWLLAGPGFLTLASTAMTYLLGLFFMFRISVSLTLIVLALVPLIIIFGRVYSRRLYRLYRDVQETLALLSDRLNNFITGIRIIKSYTMEDFVGSDFERISSDYMEKNVRVSKVSALFHGIIAGATGFGALAVLMAGGFFVIRGKMTIGSFVAFSAYIGMLSFPTIAMGWVLNLFQRGASAAGRINELIGQEGEPEPSSRDFPIESIEFRDVSFSYPGTDTPVLDGMSLTIRKGTSIGITGLTGSGKSTLVKLLLGLYPPDEGAILVNGRELSGPDLIWMREKIGASLQDSHLFSESVVENISFPLDLPDLERSKLCAGLASVDGDIDSFPDRYETVIGERGISLSGGQKQRVSMARTFCHDREILIFDDSFSSVDLATENKILANMEKLKRDKTLILISHRLSTLKACDRIVVIHRGRVVEEGSEGELMEKKGFYYRFQLQQTLPDEGTGGLP